MHNPPTRGLVSRIQTLYQILCRERVTTTNSTNSTFMIALVTCNSKLFFLLGGKKKRIVYLAVSKVGASKNYRFIARKIVVKCRFIARKIVVKCIFIASEIVVIEEAIEEGARLLEIVRLKDEQKLAATTFIQGKDTFIYLPTGYGKSLIYVLLPTAFYFYRGN